MLSRAHRGKSLPSPTVTACRKSKLLRVVPRESYSMAFFLNPSITRVLSTADGCGGTKLTAYSLAGWQQGSANNLSRGALNQLDELNLVTSLLSTRPCRRRLRRTPV